MTHSYNWYISALHPIIEMRMSSYSAKFADDNSDFAAIEQRETYSVKLLEGARCQ